MDKRSFLKHLTMGGLAFTPVFKQLDQLIASVEHLSPEEIAKDEHFWAEIRAGYRLKPDYINLENGYYCILPQETLENYLHHVREINYHGSWYMRNNQWGNKDHMAAQLAELIDCSPEEVAITRNTTESLDTIIGGYPWKEGDEAVFAAQDYGAMKHMFEQVAKRFGVVNKIISIPNHPASDEEIVKLYEQAITPKTKLLMVCHMINITGHILPIRKICDMAHAKGVEVMVDGAHALAHIPVRIPELNCDYYGSSLHKWLSVPLGAGLLYVRKEHISKIWPRFADWNKPDDDIRRLNHTGTHPVHTDLAVANALEYLYRLGPDRKEARLRYLQRYWSEQVRDLPNIMVNTPKEAHRSCAIANVGIKNMKPADMAQTLLKKYRIWTVAIDGHGVHGCRITPNIYTSTKELDTFVATLKEMQA
ncbi:MAG: aminotransferase class V-fold PLP-dependent enzyme [Saprospiraceae bacterium]|nr:aminotransferase class V-fold PLP-dependent enzyme [Saprospiraceae bacterium]